MKKKEVIDMYRAWRKAHNNQKPNRVYVRMCWEDEIENDVIDDEIVHNDIIGIENMNNLHFVDDDMVLFYAHSLGNLFQLMKRDNGSDFIVLDVTDFDKV